MSMPHPSAFSCVRRPHTVPADGYGSTRVHTLNRKLAMNHKPHTWRCLTVLFALGLHAGGASGQEMVIDATEEAPPVETGFLRLGSNRSPDGRVIGATSR